MTITYPLAIPSDLISQIIYIQVNKTGVVASAFTGSEEKQVFEGQWWIAQVAFANLTRDDAEDLLGTLAALRGRQGTCILTDVVNASPRGAAKDVPSSPRIDGSDQQGGTVKIKSGPASTVSWLRRGDRIQIGPDTRPRYHVVLEDATTDGSGKATLSIWPLLKAPVVDNDPVAYTNPKGLFELDSNQLEYTITSPTIYQISASFREAF